MSEIKAIETRYKGYRFRSRLEARWAVFFQTMRIKWEYEPQGFELPCGTRYLPDFFLPEFKLYVEVKGSEESAREAIKTLETFRDYVGAILLFVGVPEVPIAVDRYTLTGAGELFCTDTTDSSGGSNNFDAFIGSDGSHDAVVVVATGRDDRQLFRDNWFKEPLPHCFLLGDAPECIDMVQYSPFTFAVTAARSARFEHGETP